KCFPWVENGFKMSAKRGKAQPRLPARAFLPRADRQPPGPIRVRHTRREDMSRSKWARPVVVLALALGLTVPLMRADEKADAPDKKAVDAMLYKTLREVINRGAEVYKSGDHAGCYRIYEGALLATRPLLEHRPDLQKAIDKAMDDAGKQGVMWQRAFALRGGIDKIREDTNPNP